MSAPTLQPIADWLEKLGLGQYAQRFTENEIDGSVLRHLTDQDLKDMGVALGHRRKMLAAIGELSKAAGCGATFPCRSGSEAPGYRRTAAAHGDVHRSGRLYRPLDPA